MDVLIPIIAIISLFLVPITGLMLILVSRYALKPMVETLALALKESRQGEGASLMQVQELTEQVEDLAAEVQRLRSLHDFDRQLLGTGSDEEGARSGRGSPE